jgi:hypothetical protein
LKKFERRFLQTSRGVAIAAMALTGICTAAVVSWQFALLLASTGWSSLSVGRVLESADAPSPRRFATASAQQNSPFDAAIVFDWLLDLPALVPLVSALGLLGLYYAYLKSVEKKLSGA